MCYFKLIQLWYKTCCTCIWLWLLCVFALSQFQRLWPPLSFLQTRWALYTHLISQSSKCHSSNSCISTTEINHFHIFIYTLNAWWWTLIVTMLTHKKNAHPHVWTVCLAKTCTHCIVRHTVKSSSGFYLALIENMPVKMTAQKQLKIALSQWNWIWKSHKVLLNARIENTIHWQVQICLTVHTPFNGNWPQTGNTDLKRIHSFIILLP